MPSGAGIASNGSPSDTLVPTAQAPLLILEPLVHSARIADSRAPLTLDAPMVAAGTDALAARGAPRALSMPENRAECPEPCKEMNDDRVKRIAKEPQQPSVCPVVSGASAPALLPVPCAPDRRKCDAAAPLLPTPATSAGPRRPKEVVLRGAFLVDYETENADGNARQRHRHSSHGCK
eukprot:m51a1_g8557 hypothetical protein (178) ;mRNA; f:158969-159646